MDVCVMQYISEPPNSHSYYKLSYLRATVIYLQVQMLANGTNVSEWWI